MENEIDNISTETLVMIDKAMENFKKGIVSKPINLDIIEQERKKMINYNAMNLIKEKQHLT